MLDLALTSSGGRNPLQLMQSRQELDLGTQSHLSLRARQGLGLQGQVAQAMSPSPTC
jgi:hypothetical protein